MRKSAQVLGIAVSALGLTLTAAAQEAPAVTPSAAEPAAPASTPAATSDVPSDEPAPAATAPTPPPPPPPPAAGAPPPPPVYAPLGGDPEPTVEKGRWNPWDHPAPGRYSHEGFFLRMTLGFGGGRVSGDGRISGDDPEWDGVDMGLGVAIGGSIVPNLALHADFQSTLIISPDAEFRGRDTDYDGSISLSSMGIGLTYHIMPVNIFLSGSAGIGIVTFENDFSQQYDTDAGLALNFMAGKEWWVGDDWGIGVALQLVWMGVESDIDGDLSAGALNVLFSATYN